MQEPSNQKRNLLIAAIIILVLAAGAALAYILTRPADQASSNQQDTASTEKPAASSPAPDTSTETPDEPVVISFTAGGFTPNTLSVKKGAVVSVVNNSSTNMQFSSDEHPTHRDNEGMNLQILAPGESSMFKAERVGTWGFHDHIDDSKTGTLTVTE